MNELRVDNGDITLRVEVTGDGPTILCVHGWPEAPHSWRHQVAHFSERGYQVAAMDVRGYGGSSAPAEIERYTLLELASDVAAVAAALDDEPGVVEAEFAADTRSALKRVYFGLSGDAPPGGLVPDGPRDATLLSLLPDPPAGPLSFMGDADLDVYASTFDRVGVVGAFNRYRAAGFDVETSADIVGATVDQPSCFIGGEFDGCRALVPGSDWFADPGSGCTDFRGSTIIPDVGHWVQQEAPGEVNAALDAFLATLS